MTQHMMLDLETLGTKPTAATISIGAATFELTNGAIFHRFHARVAPDLAKYDVDLSTIKWWLVQEEAARQSLAQEVIDLRQGLGAFIDFWNAYSSPDCLVWAMPSAFDVPIIENALRVEGFHVPWKYNASRDVRTVCELAKITKEERVKPVLAHDALSDCEAQIATLAIAYRKLGLAP